MRLSLTSAAVGLGPELSTELSARDGTRGAELLDQAYRESSAGEIPCRSLGELANARRQRLESGGDPWEESGDRSVPFRQRLKPIPGPSWARAFQRLHLNGNTG